MVTDGQKVVTRSYTTTLQLLCIFNQTRSITGLLYALKRLIFNNKKKAPTSLDVSAFQGSSSWARTKDPLINSQML